MSKISLNRNQLKYIAILAMLIDHVAWAFVPMFSVAGQAMHFIGRFTAPIMCYFVAEGYFHTQNVRKYLLRLGIFAIISWLPFAWFELGGDLFEGGRFLLAQSVIYTLFLGLLALHIWNGAETRARKVFAVILICILSMVGDWAFFGVLWILFFGIHHGNLKLQIRSYYIVATVSMLAVILQRIPKFISGEVPFYTVLWQFGLLAAPLFLICYNGERGSGKTVHKWFFYVFYPAHLLVLCVLKYIVLT